MTERLSPLWHPQSAIQRQRSHLFWSNNYASGSQKPASTVPAKQDRPANSSPVKHCEHCGKRGHDISQCWETHGRPAKPNERICEPHEGSVGNRRRFNNNRNGNNWNQPTAGKLPADSNFVFSSRARSLPQAEDVTESWVTDSGATRGITGST